MWAWRCTFALFTVVGIILLLVPVFTIKEKDYVRSVQPTVSLKESISHAFASRHFRAVTLGQLLEGTGMSFFQACIMYYVTSLMGLRRRASVAILAVSIAGSLPALPPLINRWAKRRGSGCPSCWAAPCSRWRSSPSASATRSPGSPMVMALIFALFVSFPFAVLNILPHSMMADVIQYDTITTGVNQEGIFSAAKSFITKLGTSRHYDRPSPHGHRGGCGGEHRPSGSQAHRRGGRTLLPGAIIAFLRYNEREVLGVIRAHRAGRKEGGIKP